jgi:transcription antitermination protein NusB
MQESRKRLMRDKKIEKKYKLIRLPEKPAVKKTEGSLKARKASARLAAVQVLYQAKLNNQDIKSVVREFISHRIGFEIDGDVLVPADAELLEKIAHGVQMRWADIDGILTKALADGKKTGVETLMDCILRAGVYELLAHGQVDAGIIINDYLNVTAAFYDGTEPKLVNAILDKVAKAVRE